MERLYLGGTVYRDGKFHNEAIGVSDGVFVSSGTISDSRVEVNCNSYFILPGFVDVHVHLREPGFLYKETILTGTQAAAHGGYAAVCAMPNLSPVPDSVEHLQPQLDAIARDAVVHVYPYGAITVGEKGETLADLAALAPHVIGFTDDGRGVQSDDMMRAAMKEAKRLGKIIVAHCEDNSLLRGGYIHDGEYARTHGHKGICSESEWGQIKRDLELVRETGCSYHICHVSTKESVELIREAKREGLDVTCETCPHYLLMDDSMLQDEGRFKMNPPIRSAADREALVEALCDGTIDMIITDHAPHSEEEKSRGLAGSLNGIVGLETAFPLLYTYLVKPGILPLERLVDLMCEAPARRFGIDCGIGEGKSACFTVYDLNTEYKIDPATFLSMSKATPFTGWNVFGRCLATVVDGKLAWSDGTLHEEVK